MKNIAILLALLAVSQFALGQQEPDNDIRINLGGPDVYNGIRTFQIDSAYPGGYYSRSSVFSTPDGNIVPPVSIFHTELYSKALGGSLTNTVPARMVVIRSGRIMRNCSLAKVRTPPHSYNKDKGFDILIMGVLKKEDLDLHLLNANNPLTHAFENISVTDGVLELEFNASVQRGNVSAISVEGINANV